MSLIIDADGEYLQGTGGSFSPSSFTEMSFGLWVKRTTALSTYQGYAAIANSLSVESNATALAHYWDKTDGFIWPGPSGRRANNKGNTNSTAWQFLLFTYKQGGDVKVYTGITGGSLTNELFDGNNTTDAFSAAFTQIRIGAGMDTMLAAWNSRAKLAHCCFWTKELTAAEAGQLFNGGTAGAGKNPQAIQNANLTFYAPLTSDATATVGGVSLSATGTLTYDGADNPNVEAYGGGSTSYTLTVDSGTYSLSGASLATPISVVMATGAGTYSVTGQDITFGGSSVYTLSLEAGAYNITSETPVIGISMGLDAGSYSIVGQDVTLSSTSGGGTVYSLSIEAGTYTTTGQDLSLIVAYLASLDAGTYDVTGKNVRLVSSTEPVIISSGNHTISVSIKIGI